MFAGSILFWLIGHGVWRYAVLEVFGLIYFYLRWSAPDAQHRQFHFLLMCTFMTTTAFYAYRLAVQPMMPSAFAMAPWHYQLLHNVIFVFELLLVTVYALLYRRAKANKQKYYADVDGWFAKADEMKRGLSDSARQGLWQKKKQ